MPWKKKSEVNWKLRSRTPITVLFFPRPGWACNERSSGGLSGSQFVFVLFMWAGQQLRRATRKNHQTFNRWNNTNKHITGWYVIKSDVITQLFLLLSTSSGDLAAVTTKKKQKKHKIQMLHFLSQLCLVFFFSLSKLLCDREIGGDDAGGDESGRFFSFFFFSSPAKLHMPCHLGACWFLCMLGRSWLPTSVPCLCARLCQHPPALLPPEMAPHAVFTA